MGREGTGALLIKLAAHRKKARHFTRGTSLVQTAPYRRLRSAIPMLYNYGDIKLPARAVTEESNAACKKFSE